MKLSSKYFKVIFKLYIRSLKRSPHVFALSLMGFITFGLSSFIVTDAWFNHGKFNQSTFTAWNNFQKEITGRNIASSDSIQCNINSIDLNLLKNEIKGLETQYETGHYIEGSLFSINLKSLPSVQAQFLADFGDYIGTQNQSQNFSQCENLPCILTTLYNGDELSGHLAYYWYLKTGSMLSVGNKLPNQISKMPGEYDGKKFPLSEYLFTAQELKNFYVLAKSLPEKFLHIPLLKSIHKVPQTAKIEGYSFDECAISMPSGQILISEKCLGSQYDLKGFLLKMANQMAKYIDVYEGRKEDFASISSSPDWKEKSLWIKDSYFDIHNKKYSQKWFSFIPKTQFVSETSAQTPGQQLSQLLAYYRFAPELFSQKTPIDLQAFVREKFFNGQSFDGNGLYNQYLSSAVETWSKEESNLWGDCFEQYLKPDSLGKSPRDLASQADNPLYSCVEHKIPNFIQEVENKIKAENFEGCQFFNNKNQYGHLAKKFHHVLDKFLQEKVLKRKIEFQNHGKEVLIGQTIKDEFIKSTDPASVFINCFSSSDQKSCYENKLTSELNKIFNKHHNDLSEYYRNILHKDILSMNSFSSVAEKTNELAKKFIAPFYNRIHFAATDLWNKCKEEKFSEDQLLSLPLRFTGGKNFVNSKLLNCINSKIDSELYQIVNMGAFQEVDEKIVEFELNSQEKDFALSFMEGKLVQILNNILQEEVKLEKVKLRQHFNESKDIIISDFLEKSDLFDEVYSFSQISNECLDRVSAYYPKKYFYSSKKSLNKKFGREICSVMMKDPKVNGKINQKVAARWNDNKKLAESFLDAHFEEFVDECKDDYPVEEGRSFIRNSRMRKICIEESYGMAINEAIMEWREDDNYEYFAAKEQNLINVFMKLKNSKIQNAIK